MDEELQAYLAAMEQRIIAALLEPLNAQLDDIRARLIHLAPTTTDRVNVAFIPGGKS